MALNVDTNFPPSGPAPYRIDPGWCIGDSLTIINNNSFNFDNRLENLDTRATAISAGVDTKVSKSGDTMSGALTINNGLEVKDYINIRGSAGSALFFYDRNLNNTTGALYRSGNINRLWDQAAGDVITYNSSGNVGIGTASPSRKLDVIGEIRSTGANIMNYNAPTLFFQDTDNRSGMIHVNGNVMHILRGTGNNSLDWTTLSNNQWPLVISLENGDNIIGGNCFIQNGIVSLRNTAGTFRYIQYLTAAADRSAATSRFDAGITDGAETGSNAGSDYFIHRFSDNGTYLGRPLFISRSNGNVALENYLYTNTLSNPLAITSGWTGYPDSATNRAEIANDTGTYKTLMIVGNRSNDAAVRRVSVWDRLEVNGTLSVTGNATVATPTASTHVATKGYVDGQSLGVGQVWYNFTGSRASGVTYTNTTGRTIVVCVAACNTNGSAAAYVNGIFVGYGTGVTGYSQYNQLTMIVPPGNTYLVTGLQCTTYWAELR